MTSATTSLSSRARPAAVWTFAGIAFGNVVRLMSNLLLTRLLAPDLYGLMSVGNVIVSALVMLSDIGLAQSVIQNTRGHEPRFLNTVWTVKVARGLFLTSILGLIAAALTITRMFAPGMLSGSYADPRLVQVLLILLFLPIAEGFESTNLILLRRSVNLKPVVLIELGAQLFSTVIMAAMALWYASIWVLPIGWVLYCAFKTAISFMVEGPGNRFCWDGEVAREVWHFSKWILFSSSLTFIYRDGDRFILGGLLNAREMGIYGVSGLIVSATKQVVGMLAGNVGMPALSEIARTRPTQLPNAYRRCRLPIDVVCMSTAGLLFGAAPLIVRILFDQRYQDATPIFRLVSLILIPYRYVLFDQLLVAIGKTKQLFKRGVLQAAVMVTALPVGYHLDGMMGAVYGLLIANFAIVPLYWYLETREELFDWRGELKVLPAFAAGAIFGYAPIYFGLMP